MNELEKVKIELVVNGFEVSNSEKRISVSITNNYSESFEIININHRSFNSQFEFELLNELGNIVIVKNMDFVFFVEPAEYQKILCNQTLKFKLELESFNFERQNISLMNNSFRIKFYSPRNRRIVFYSSWEKPYFTITKSQ